MSLNSTIKKNKRFRHKTAKSGGAKSKFKFSSSAKEFVPVSASTTKPNAVNNLSSRMAAVSLTNKSGMNFMTAMAIEALKIKTFVENAVAIDCEMVGVGPIKEDGTTKSSLARVAICDFNGKRLMDKFVIPKEGIEAISDYRTNYSGITPEKLVRLDKTKHSYEKVKAEVHKLVEGKVIVGHGLINDFKVLDLEVPPNRKWDSTELDVFKKNHSTLIRAPRKLKEIAKEFAGNNIQLAERTGHSPLEDARAAMNLYRIFYSYPKVEYRNMTK
jgi:hypothetical protein